MLPTLKKVIEFICQLFTKNPPSLNGLERVYSQSQRSLTGMAFAAIAIKNVDIGQQHIGILHRHEDSNEIMFLHLAWHHDLRNHPPGIAYFWIAPRIPAARLRQVAAKCRQIFRANPHGIPYAFSQPNDCFDPQTYEFLIGPTRHGLTCATFVLAVFEQVGLKLVHYGTWPHRIADLGWQQFVISQLETANPPASQQHIEAVRNEVGGIRIRPEEVAGAAALLNHPIDFDSVSGVAQGIVLRLQSG